MRAKAKTRRISIAQNELRLSGVCSPRIRNCGNCLHLSYAQSAFCLLPSAFAGGALNVGDPVSCACALRMKVKPRWIAHFVFFSSRCSRSRTRCGCGCGCGCCWSSGCGCCCCWCCSCCCCGSCRCRSLNCSTKLVHPAIAQAQLSLPGALSLSVSRALAAAFAMTFFYGFLRQHWPCQKAYAGKLCNRFFGLAAASANCVENTTATATTIKKSYSLVKALVIDICQPGVCP